MLRARAIMPTHHKLHTKKKRAQSTGPPATLLRYVKNNKVNALLILLMVALILNTTWSRSSTDCQVLIGQLNGKTLHVEMGSGMAQCCALCQNYVGIGEEKCIGWTFKTGENTCKLRGTATSVNDFPSHVYGLLGADFQQTDPGHLVVANSKGKFSPSPDPEWASDESHMCYPFWENWLKPYKQRHRQILTEEPYTGKFLVYQCHPDLEVGNGPDRKAKNHCGGLGDMTRGIVSAVLLGSLLDRAVLLDWTKPTRIDDFFEPNQIMWSYHDFIGRYPEAVHEIGPTKYWLKFRGWKDINLEEELPNRIEMMQLIQYRLSWELQSNPLYKDRIKAMGMKQYWSKKYTYALQGCTLWFLLRQSGYMGHLIRREKKRLGIMPETTLIGIHARLHYFGDAPFMDKDEEIEINRPLIKSIVNCAEFFEQETGLQNTKWYLAVDQPETKEVFHQYSSKIVYSDVPLVHVDRANASVAKPIAKWTFMEFVMLSEASHFVVTLGGFGWQAANLGLIPLHNRHRALPCCEKDDGRFHREKEKKWNINEGCGGKGNS